MFHLLERLAVFVYLLALSISSPGSQIKEKDLPLKYKNWLDHVS